MLSFFLHICLQFYENENITITIEPHCNSKSYTLQYSQREQLQKQYKKNITVFFFKHIPIKWYYSFKYLYYMSLFVAMFLYL